MKQTIEEYMLRAWQEYRYGADHEFDPNEPIKPSDNFERGFIAGQSFALTHQWRSVEDEEPPIGKVFLCRDADSVTLCTYDGEYMYEVHNDYKCRMPYWCYIPTLNPEQK